MSVNEMSINVNEMSINEMSVNEMSVNVNEMSINVNEMSINVNEMSVNEMKTRIKYLVISGGGPVGLITYGAVRDLAKANLWKLSDLEGIYCCSIGAYLAIIISLGYEWDWLDDYLIRRPWEKIVSITAENLFSAFSEKGILGEQFITDALSPLLSAKGLDPLTCTLADLFSYNSIDIHLYTTNINSPLLEKLDISHKTHPSMTIVKAVCMSSAYPLVFKPIFLADEGCFIDGGLLNNYPLNDCLVNADSPDSILAFKNIWIYDTPKITESSSVLDLLLIIVQKMQKHIDSEPYQKKVKNTVECIIENLNDFTEWAKALSTEEMRYSLVQKGTEYAKLFLDSDTNR